MPNDDTPRREPPSRAASPEAMSVLLTLHRHAGGLLVSDLQRLTAIAPDDLAACLRGLRERDRIVPDGKGVGARWRTRQHALAASRAAAKAAQ